MTDKKLLGERVWWCDYFQTVLVAQCVNEKGKCGFKFIVDDSALIVTPDEDGEWPWWAVDPGYSPLTADALKTKGLRVALLDALRDAKPDGGGE